MEIFLLHLQTCCYCLYSFTFLNVFNVLYQVISLYYIIRCLASCSLHLTEMLVCVVLIKFLMLYETKTGFLLWCPSKIFYCQYFSVRL